MKRFAADITKLIENHCERIASAPREQVPALCAQTAAVLANLAGQMIAATGLDRREIDKLVIQAEEVTRRAAEHVAEAVDRELGLGTPIRNRAP